MNTLFNLSEAATIALHSLAIIGNSEERLNVNTAGREDQVLQGTILPKS